MNARNPTPEERDEPFSLYGLNPDDVGEAILAAEPESEPATPPKRKRTKS